MKHILLIDDDTRFLVLLGDYLEECGYQLSRAANGKHGIELLSQLTNKSPYPDLIICDVMMPQMDGYEFVRTLRTMLGREMLPIIFLSAKREVNDRVRGLKEGADAYLVKPFEPNELVALADAMLRRSEHLQTVGSALGGWRNSGELTIGTQFEVGFTKTEGKVLRYVARGLSNKEIAKEMRVSIRTVETHVSNMLQKTLLTNRTRLTRWAVESGHIRTCEGF
jgi:DNA-binding NarL/FixJ family response regulator